MTWTIRARFQTRGNPVAAPRPELDLTTTDDGMNLTFQPEAGGEPVTLLNKPQTDGRRYAHIRQSGAGGYQSKVVPMAYGGEEYAVIFLGKKGDSTGDDDTEVFVATSGGGDQDPDG